MSFWFSLLHMTNILQDITQWYTCICIPCIHFSTKKIRRYRFDRIKPFMMWYRYLNDDLSECIWFLLGQDVKCSQYSKVKWDFTQKGPRWTNNFYKAYWWMFKIMWKKYFMELKCKQTDALRKIYWKVKWLAQIWQLLHRWAMRPMRLLTFNMQLTD